MFNYRFKVFSLSLSTVNVMILNYVKFSYILFRAGNQFVRFLFGTCKPWPNACFVFVDDELISPCMCKGTQQFVHRACLDHWRSVKVN